MKRVVARLLEVRLRWSAQRLGMALCYHRVGDPEGDTEHELVPPMGTKRFEAQVRYLRRHYRLVRASELVDAIAGRPRGGRIPMAITFDDDTRSHARYAMPILRRVKAPATFFLCGASLDQPYEFWWERLQRAWDGGVVDEGLLEKLGARGSYPGQPPIRRVAAAMEHLPPARRDEVCAELGALVEANPDAGMRAQDVARLADAGFEIGFHTLRHYSLPALDDATLAEALTEGRHVLEGKVGSAVTAIAYPHGDADGRVADAARAVGYRFGFSAYGAPIAESADPLLLDRRYPVVGSQGEFAFDLARKLWGAARD